MNTTRLFYLLVFNFLWARPMVAQLSAKDLEKAVAQQACEAIAADLEKTTLHSEAMKFNGAVCLYRNGQIDRAMALFEEVVKIGAQKQQIAAFWVAKCQAALHHDSLALALLQQIPRQALHYNMLIQPEFAHLAQHSPAFAQLKAQLKPGFNLWTGGLAFIAGIGLLSGLLLLFGQSRFSAGEKRLAVVMLAATLILISYILMWTGFNASFPYLQNLWPFLTLLIGPSLFFYLKDTFKEPYSTKVWLMHYLLPMLSGLLSLPAILADWGLPTGLSSDFFLLGTSSTLLTGHLLYYALQIDAMTRNDWQVDANIKAWTGVVARGMWAYTLAFLSYFVLVRCSFFNPEWDYAISFVMAVGILAVAYMGLVQKRVFRSEPIGHFLPVKKYQTSALTPGASDSIRRKMERLLVEEKVFKENELRLDDLAAYLEVSRHQLSQVINEHYGVNFFELINRYRVAHVKRLLADPAYSHYTIIQMAYEAGFNNKASFNRYFKQETGLTPSAFRIKESSGGGV